MLGCPTRVWDEKQIPDYVWNMRPLKCGKDRDAIQTFNFKLFRVALMLSERFLISRINVEETISCQIFGAPICITILVLAAPVKTTASLWMTVKHKPRNRLLLQTGQNPTQGNRCWGYYTFVTWRVNAPVAVDVVRQGLERGVSSRPG